jgi:hypothetical protein
MLDLQPSLYYKWSWKWSLDVEEAHDNRMDSELDPEIAPMDLYEAQHPATTPEGRNGEIAPSSTSRAASKPRS